MAQEMILPDIWGAICKKCGKWYSPAHKSKMCGKCRSDGENGRKKGKVTR